MSFKKIQATVFRIFIVTTIIFQLAGCATRALWRPDHEAGLEEIARSDSKISAKAEVKDNKLLVYVYQQGEEVHDDFMAEMPSREYIPISEFKLLNIELISGEIHKYLQIENIGLVELLPNDVKNLSQPNNIIKVFDVKARLAPKYELGKTAGRVLITPFAVTADVVSVAVIVVTAPIWLPLGIYNGHKHGIL